MASSKHSAKPAPNQRLPAPQLFVGPPSRNASSTSLLAPPGAAAPAARAPLTRQRSYLRNETRTDAPGPSNEPQAETLLTPAAPFGRRQPVTQAQGMGADHKSQERTDAIWTEMQNTLKEVELNAANGSHVFSERHAKALDELRVAQIALAQAWARSEADENATANEETEAIKRNYAERENQDAAETFAADRKMKMAGEGPKHKRDSSGASARSVSSMMEKSQLEQETEHDISLARRRREANDRYFQRVNAGVVGVVAKLEDVARAMKGVEIESREIWGDEEESVGTASAVG